MSIETSEYELQQLLLSMFDADGIRRFISRRPRGEAMARELPGSTASIAELAYGAECVLERHGAVDAELFEALQAERPLRKTDILAVATSYGIDLSPRGEDRTEAAEPEQPPSISEPSVTGKPASPGQVRVVPRRRMTPWIAVIGVSCLLLAVALIILLLVFGGNSPSGQSGTGETNSTSAHAVEAQAEAGVQHFVEPEKDPSDPRERDDDNIPTQVPPVEPPVDTGRPIAYPTPPPPPPDDTGGEEDPEPLPGGEEQSAAIRRDQQAVRSAKTHGESASAQRNAMQGSGLNSAPHLDVAADQTAARLLRDSGPVKCPQFCSSLTNATALPDDAKSPENIAQSKNCLQNNPGDPKMCRDSGNMYNGQCILPAMDTCYTYLPEKER